MRYQSKNVGRRRRLRTCGGGRTLLSHRSCLSGGDNLGRYPARLRTRPKRQSTGTHYRGRRRGRVPRHSSTVSHPMSLVGLRLFALISLLGLVPSTGCQAETPPAPASPPPTQTAEPEHAVFPPYAGPDVERPSVPLEFSEAMDAYYRQLTWSIWVYRELSRAQDIGATP